MNFFSFWKVKVARNLINRNQHYLATVKLRTLKVQFHLIMDKKFLPTLQVLLETER